MKKLECLGAAGEVTGSAHLLTSNIDSKVLVDCGSFQGSKKNVRKNNEKILNFNPNKLDGVIITHGHLDHCGRLPQLVIRDGYKGPIFMTEPTSQLVNLILLDSAKISLIDKHKFRLMKNDVGQIMDQVETYKYDEEFNIGNFRAAFRDTAGHILGSASVELNEMNGHIGQTIIFSGDLGNNNKNDIVKATEKLSHADIVVMESTYGDRSHSNKDPYDVVENEILATIKSQGTLLIPSFAIQKTQSLLHIIHDLKIKNQDNKNIWNIPVFLDSPMAINATEIYSNNRDYLGNDLYNDGNAFQFNGYIPVRNGNSKIIEEMQTPKIIIAGSGMMIGGRIGKHAIKYLPEKNSRILFIGYQAEGTPGREIMDGYREVGFDQLDEFGNKNIVDVKVNASVTGTDALSSHADQQHLLEWLSPIKGVQKLVVVHGETRQRLALSNKTWENFGIRDIYMPLRSQIVNL